MRRTDATPTDDPPKKFTADERQELAVLSACETGPGDVAGGEGTFLAGTRNVVASPWKAPDEAFTLSGVGTVMGE